MKYKIIIGVLVFILFLGWMQMRELIRQVNILNNNYATLLTSFNDLQQKNDQLMVEHYYLQADFNSLESDYNSLKEDLTSLKQDYLTLQAEYWEAERLLRQYENVPHSYYYTDAFKQYSNTWEELSKFLKSGFRLPVSYEEDVFDCSESSAFVEWALESAGFDAEIASGPTPWDPSSGHHAWVIVHTKEYKVAIESTALTGKQRVLFLMRGRIPGVVYSKDRLIDGWENYYYGYDETYENIYYAVRSDYSTLQWDWWEEFWEY